MECGEASAVDGKKASLTPKAIIHQKFGTKACYKIEEVKESVENGCSGLVILQQGPRLFRCSLQLPDISVTSGTFTRKKEAEQCAAKMALEKLGIQPTSNNPTTEEVWDDLVGRVSFIFSNEFLSGPYPLSGHLRAALQREGDHRGFVPISVLPVCDTKLNNLCKAINSKVESDPSLTFPFIVRAARLSGSVATYEGKFWIWRQNPYPSEIIEALKQQSISAKEIWIEAILIPCSIGKPVEPVTLNVPPNGYYMDIIARKLGLTDASEVMVSRTIGKASSEMRMYFSSLELCSSDLSSEDLFKANRSMSLQPGLNRRASYFSGQNIYGDAVLAAVGYTWNSTDIFHEDVSLCTYYRMLLGRLPSGGYKLSREAILVAKLPESFTTRSNWRGSSPRDLLCMFCRQHRLSEPVFSVISNPLDSLSEASESCKKLKSTKPTKDEVKHANGGAAAVNGEESLSMERTFRCELKILSKDQDLIIECSPKDCYRKQNDAIQNTALKVLSWLNEYFKDLDMPMEKLTSSADILNISFHPQNFCKEFTLCLSVHTVQQRSALYRCSLLVRGYVDQSLIGQGQGECFLRIEGPESGISPSNGSLVCISYAVSLVMEQEHMKERLESNDEFEFELGTGAVIPQLESCVAQMFVNQSAYFNAELPHQDLILAASGNCGKFLSLLSSDECYLEYSLTLLRVTEPLEDRMEQALFSPPLSKQRVECALSYIRGACAASLVDFGCGSGSLLDSLLDHPTTLQRVVGVDISRKALCRAAKVLHSKLSKHSDAVLASMNLKSVLLYDGSITVFDSRLYDFDIGTCIEVIEHMEEDQACLFGDIVLSNFCPRILIVSTPNYEYNPILQRIATPNREEDTDEKTESIPCKFRNHDHKFEWTREQFSTWASELAARHNYSVEFSGVGGSADIEPGFASQIAVFRRGLLHQGYKCVTVGDSAHHYELLWEWSSNDGSKHLLPQ